jgi:hypothetical protein
VQGEVERALVGECGRSDPWLAAEAFDGGARAEHRQLGRPGTRGIWGSDRFIVDARSY